MEYEEAAEVLRPSAAVAIASYGTLIAGHHEQSLRTGEANPGGDAWASRAGRFRPGGFGSEELDVLCTLALPDDTWLDVGAGGGRFAIPLATRVARVVAVEPSPAMRKVLGEAISDGSVANIDVIPEAWPPPTSAGVPIADVSLVANVLYGVEDIGTFLEALEAHTRRCCVVIAADPSPNTPHVGVWEALWGEPRRPLPGARELIGVLMAMGRGPAVYVLPPTPAVPTDPDATVDEFAWMYRVSRGSADAARLRALFVERFGQPDGTVLLPPRRQRGTILTWTPRH